MKIKLLSLTLSVFFTQFSFAQVNFDGSEIINRFPMHKQMEAAQEEIQGKPGDGDYLRTITIPENGAQRDVSFTLKSAFPIQKGDPIIVRMVAAGTGLDGAEAQVHLKLQEHQSPYPTLSGRNQPLTPEFETYELVHTAEKDYPAGKVALVMFAGQKAQTLQLQSLKIFAGAESAAEASSGEQVLYYFGFEDGLKEVSAETGSKAGISGKIPQQMTEDTSWADVDVVYTPVQEGTFVGKQSLRIDVQRVDEGYAQLRLDQFPADNDQYLKLSFGIKSTVPSPITMAIRKKDPPYRKSWQSDISASPEWKGVELLIPPLPRNPDAEFIIEFRSPGVYALDEFKIVSIPKGAIEQGTANTGNLLLNSSFPFGYQRPWRGSTNTAEVTGDIFHTDPDQPGPTGQPALKVLGTGFHEFVRLPFKGDAGKEHTVSFWAKSDKIGTKITPRIGPPSEKLYKGKWGHTFTLTDQWQRYSHTVMLPFHADGFYEMQLYMRNQDTIWLDGLMVEAADIMQEFKRVAPVELSVIPTHGADNEHNLFFPGEAISLQVGLLGDVPAGAKLVIRTQPFGYPGDEKSVALPLESVERQVVTADIPFESLGLPEFGTAYVRFQVEDANGEALSKLSETSVHVVRQPRGYGKFIHDSPFGVHTAPEKGLIYTSKRLGYNWARSFHMGWMYIQPEQGGEWDWSRLDKLVGWWRDSHMEVLGIYGHPPVWANLTGGRMIKGAGWKNFLHAVNDDHMDEWADYAARLSARYEDVVRVYETWNEPFLAGFFLQSWKDGQSIHAEPERLYRMSKAIHDRLEQDGIDVKLAWNYGPHYPKGDAFDRKGVELGMLDIHDMVSYHSYERNLGGYPGDPYQQIIDKLKAFNAESGAADLKIWNTEGGPGAGHQHNIYPSLPIRDVSGRELHYSKYLVRAWNSMLSNGVERYFIYFLNKGGVWKGDYDLMQPDGSLAPNQIAFSNMAWHIEGKTFQEIVPLPESFHAYIYEGPDGVAASIIPQANGNIKLPAAPAGGRYSDLYGNELRGDVASVDFWLHVDGAKAQDIITLLKDGTVAATDAEVTAARQLNSQPVGSASEPTAVTRNNEGEPSEIVTPKPEGDADAKEATPAEPKRGGIFDKIMNILKGN